MSLDKEEARKLLTEEIKWIASRILVLPLPLAPIMILIPGSNPIDLEE
jgi:hypothetical protein